MRAHDAARTTAPASTDQHGCCETIPRAETLEEFQEYVCKGHPAIYNLPGSDDGEWRRLLETEMRGREFVVNRVSAPAPLRPAIPLAAEESVRARSFTESRITRRRYPRKRSSAAARSSA